MAAGERTGGADPQPAHSQPAQSQPAHSHFSEPTDVGPTDLGDGVRIEEAAVALQNPDDIQRWATRFSLLGDVNRLKILFALHRAPGLTVGDLATVVDMTENAVSHALAALKVANVVATDRDGRYRRVSVTDDDIHTILHTVGASHSDLHPNH